MLSIVGALGVINSVLVGVTAGLAVAALTDGELWAATPVGLAVFAVAQVLVVLETPVPPVLPWILFGFAGQAGNLGYATLAAHFGAGAAGRAQSAANLVLFTTAWGLQWGIGEILDFFPGATEGASAPEGYRWAFGFAFVLQIMAVCWYLRSFRRKIPAK